MRNQNGETKNTGDCHSNVILATACWSSGQIKELCGARGKRDEGSKGQRGTNIW